MTAFLNFFTESDPVFGPISVVTGLFWLALLAFGVYALRGAVDANPSRARFMRRFAMVASILGGVGALLLLLNLLGVPGFNIRLWMYLVAFATLGYLGYTIYEYNTRLPAQIAATRPTRVARPQSQGPRGGARTYPANGTTTPTTTTPKPPREPRPVATTTRREARRDKKRKTR